MTDYANKEDFIRLPTKFEIAAMKSIKSKRKISRLFLFIFGRNYHDYDNKNR